jgi:hypothetical protein
MEAAKQKTVSQLVSDAFSQFSLLIQNEFALAQAEVTEKVKGFASGAALVGAGLLLALPASVVLFMGIALLFNQWGVSPVVSHFASAALGMILGAIIVSAGLKKLRPSLMPEQTIGQLRKDVAAAKEIIQ